MSAGRISTQFRLRYVVVGSVGTYEFATADVVSRVAVTMFEALFMVTMLRRF